MTASLWVIGEGHHHAREWIIERVRCLLFDPPSEGPAHGEAAHLVMRYATLAGDTHALFVDTTRREVFEGQIDRSGRKNLH